MTEDLIINGADVVKVGIGPGSVCTTRKHTRTVQEEGPHWPDLGLIWACSGRDLGVIWPDLGVISA